MIAEKLHSLRIIVESLIFTIAIILPGSLFILNASAIGGTEIPEKILPHFPSGGLLYLAARSVPDVIEQTMEQPLMKMLSEESGRGELTEVIDSELSKIAPGLSLDSLLAIFPGELVVGIYRSNKTEFLLGLELGDAEKLSALFEQMQSKKGEIEVEVKKKMKNGFNFYQIKTIEHPVGEKGSKTETKETQFYLAFNDKVLLASKSKKLTEKTIENFAEGKTPLNQETALVIARGELSSNVQLYMLVDGQRLAELLQDKFQLADESKKPTKSDFPMWTRKIFSFLDDFESISLGFSYPAEEETPLPQSIPTDEVSIHLIPNSDLSSIFEKWKGLNAEKKAPLVVPEDTAMLIDVTSDELFYPEAELFTSFLSFMFSRSAIAENPFDDIFDILPTPPELSFIEEDTLKSCLGNESAIAYLPGGSGINFLTNISDKTQTKKYSLNLYSIEQIAGFEDKYLGYMQNTGSATVETIPYEGGNIYHLIPSESAKYTDEKAINDWMNSFLQESGGSDSASLLSPEVSKAYMKEIVKQLQQMYPIIDSYVFFLSDFMVIAYDYDFATRTIDQYLSGEVLGKNPKFSSYLSHLDTDNYSLFYVSELLPQNQPSEESGQEKQLPKPNQNSASQAEKLLQSMLNEGFALTTTLGENSLKIEGYPQALNKMLMSIFYTAFSAYESFGGLNFGNLKSPQPPERQNPLLNR